MADEEKDERSPEEIAAEEEMLKYAQSEDESSQQQDQVDVEKAKFKEFDQNQNASDSIADSGNERIAMLMDIVLPVSIELGRTKMFIKDILELERGSIVEIDKLAGEPVDLLVNNKKMAEGEVVVVEKHFGIRITNLIDPKDRIKNLGA